MESFRHVAQGLNVWLQKGNYAIHYNYHSRVYDNKTAYWYVKMTGPN